MAAIIPVFSTPAESPAPLQVNGKRGAASKLDQPPAMAAKPAEPAQSNSVETLLAAAEKSGDARAVALAAQIRELVAGLVELVRKAARKNELEALAADLERRLAEAQRELESIAEPERPKILHASNEEIRAWARKAGFDVKSRGSLSHLIVLAFERAHGGVLA